jgi:hypothetical protein
LVLLEDVLEAVMWLSELLEPMMERLDDDELLEPDAIQLSPIALNLVIASCA